MSAVNNAMKKLTAQWYNALTAGLNLSPKQFQIYQSTNTVGSTSEWIWNIANAIPPKSVNSFYDPNQANNFNQNYQGVIANLQPMTDNSFQNCMGDYYNDWMNYLKAPTTTLPADFFTDATVMSTTFKKWALINAPSQSGCVASLISDFFNDIVTNANALYANAAAHAEKNNQPVGVYNTTIEKLKNALTSAPGANFTMNSLTESSDVSHTWASGGVDLVFDIFEFGGGATYDSLTEKATTAGINMDVKFSNVSTVAVGPLAETSTGPILSRYRPWYMSSALSRAFGTKDNTVWKHGAPSWDTTFGSDGNMQRMVSALVVVDGITVTMTSNAGYSSAEQTKITTAAEGGLWPFFTVAAEGGNTTKVTFDDQGSMTATMTNPKGNPQLIGVLVTDAKDYLGG